MNEPLRPHARRTTNRFGTLAILALLPAVVIYGWRAILIVACVVLSNLFANRLLSEPRPPGPRWPPLLPVDALLLSCLLPADLAGSETWPWLICGGLFLSLLQRIRRDIPGVPFDAALFTALALFAAIALTSSPLTPRAALQRSDLVTGDVTRAATAPASVEPWFKRPIARETPALRTPWAAAALDDYIRGPVMPGDRARASLDGVIRDRLPPLEDLVLLGHPMPLGQASGVFLIGIVLWGAHRRAIDWRVPIVGGTVAYIALIVLAVPTSVSSEGGNWRFLAAARADVGPATAFTFSHYLAFASPIPIALGLFAPRLDTKPLRIGATIVWAAFLGIAVAAAALYASVAVGPLAVIAFAPLLARLADRVVARRPMRLPD